MAQTKTTVRSALETESSPVLPTLCDDMDSTFSLKSNSRNSSEGTDSFIRSLEDGEDVEENTSKNPTTKTKKSKSKKGAVSLEKKKTSNPKTSKVWKEFTKFKENEELPDGTITTVRKAKCVHCEKVFSGDVHKNGTTSLRRHLNNACKARPRGPDGQAPGVGMIQSLLSFKPGTETENSGIFPWKYDYETCRRKLIMIIIRDELPFRFVESVALKEFCAALNPKFTIPSRVTVKRDVMSFYEEEKGKLIKIFAKSKPRVCLTTDTWTSLQQISYMCITLHYIDDDWKLVKKLINFVPIISHSGESIHRCITRCLDDWGIDKIFTVTVDNASSNDAALNGLKVEFGNRPGGVLSGMYMHLRCAAHIVNLVCQDGLKLHEASVAVKRIRDAVRYVKSSPKRLEMFKRCMVKEGDLGKMELILDVKTRWNSTYMMLVAASSHEKAWKRYAIDEECFARDMAASDKHGIPTSPDWEYARKLRDFLECFYDFTLKVSGSSYVTAHSFYAEMATLHDNLKMWMDGDNIEMAGAAKKMKQKFDKYWGQSRECKEAPEKKAINLLLFIATILDPRYKMSTIELTLEFVYEGQMLEDVLCDIQIALDSLYEHYKGEFEFDNSSSSIKSSSFTSSVTLPPPTTFGSKPKLNLLAKTVRKVRGSTGTNPRKSDLETYLGEPMMEEEEPFDILQWWRNNAGRLPILARMARDVLAIPISTVPSESAFSTGGRVLDAFRSSLATKTVEALLCCQSWIKGLPILPTNVIDVDEEYDEVELTLQTSATPSVSAPTPVPNEDESAQLRRRKLGKEKESEMNIPNPKRRNQAKGIIIRDRDS